VNSDSPVITILVATWNSAPDLEDFLESLLNQSWQDWQLLLLDNASQDGSDEVVARAKSRLRPPQQLIWSSQPDHGIYDAWNRGLKLARGHYLCFIGADDRFVSEHSLANIMKSVDSRAELITAQNAYYSRTGRFLRVWGSAWRWSRMRQSMNIAHPGMLVHQDLFRKYGDFDDSFHICGDYEWFLRLPAGVKAVHLEIPVLKVIQGGVSHTRIRQVYAETFQAQRRHCGLFTAAVHWCLNWIKFARRRMIGLAS